MELKNEILDDYESYCDQKLLREFGSYSVGTYDPIYLYERYKCRIIEARPRQVSEASSFVCPSSHLNAYQNIKSDIQRGNDLKKYQSRRLKSLDYDDDMLSHWGIQHLHFGQSLDSDGFVNRTGNLLFVYFTHSHAYVVGVYGHGDWTDTNIIQVIHDDWPHELHVFKSNSNNTPVRLTSQDYKVLRKKGANSSVIVSDGTEYISPGMGVTCNKAPISATVNSSRIIYEFNLAYDSIVENIYLILESDPMKRKSDIITIGFEGIDNSNVAIYKIKETGHKFTISS